jgi:hypothetical protein
MKGGVILLRSSGADARRYLESDRSRADEYDLEGGVALAEGAIVEGLPGAPAVWMPALTGRSPTESLKALARQLDGSPRLDRT